MGHHKRGKPRSRRAGCKLCKWHKCNEFKDSLKALRARDFREKERLDASEKEARYPA